MVYSNSGGRTSYVVGSKVLILKVDGSIESGYTVQEPRSDRNACVLVTNGTTSFRCQHRRVLPDNGESVGYVIESGGISVGVCPKCNSTTIIELPTAERAVCVACKHSYDLLRLGTKMTKTDETKTKKESKEKTARVAKPKTEAVKVDFKALAAMPNIEVWSKTVQFDHPKIVSKAHALLYVGEEPRKYCFNTYDGTLGRDAGPLPVEQFINNTAIVGAKKERPWYVIKNLDKVRETLHKSGFKKHPHPTH